jgi:hypothetical protein
MTAHETSQDAILARRKRILAKLLTERGLLSRDDIDAQAVRLADGRTWQQVEEDQQKRTIRIRNKRNLEHG